MLIFSPRKAWKRVDHIPIGLKEGLSARALTHTQPVGHI